MDRDGKSEQVLLRAVQWHPYKQLVLHVDFQRVDASQTLSTKVPLHFINAEVSPAVKLNSAVISQDRTSVVSGKSVSVRVDLGGRRIIQQNSTVLTWTQANTNKRNQSKQQ